MILPSFSLGGVFVITPVQASSDNTPSSVNWSTINVATPLYTTQQITSISSTISLSLTATHVTGGLIGTRLWYKLDNTSPSYTTGTPSSNGFTQISSYPISIVVSNNQYLSFGVASATNRGANTTITVTNTSDSNTVLDSFSVLY